MLPSSYGDPASLPDSGLLTHEADSDSFHTPKISANDIAEFTLLPEHLERLIELGVPTEQCEEVAQNLSLLILSAFDMLLGTSQEP